MKFKENKVYQICIDYGEHIGLITTNQIDFTIWIRELSKEFKIYTEISAIETIKVLYIYNYWGNRQTIAFITTK